jgi:predicted RNase H-like HicB family nuclease
MTNDTINQNSNFQRESLEELRANLNKALSLLITAVDQSSKLSLDDNLKRPIANEWETIVNTWMGYVKSQARKDTQNLMSWFSMINLKL